MTVTSSPTLLPRIALTVGDPAGIGPEILVRSWARLRHGEVANYVVVGRAGYLRQAVSLLGSDVHVIPADPKLACTATAPASSASQMVVLEVGDESLDGVPPGRLDPRGGELAFQSVERACLLALQGHVEAMVTCPLNKLALHRAGHDFPGHTELLARLCGVDDVAMMLYVPEDQMRARVPARQSSTARLGLGVVHATLHESLRSAIDGLSAARVLACCRLADEAGRRLAGAAKKCGPRIAVAALNPHGGEGGLFGNEESEIIAPAVTLARQAGLACAGPFPCDTLMARAAGGEFDFVVAMVHDQGHIALKLLGMHDAVNVTLGLPIIRTSVAHGTAYDLAGTGRADAGSLLRAARVACQMALVERPEPVLPAGAN